MENIDSFAEEWKETLLKLMLSHRREERDTADYRMDDLFNQLFAMPVKQVREFYDIFTAKMKDDERVPYFIWRIIEKWKDDAVGISQEVEAKILQTEIAQELAALLEPKLSSQLQQALQDSLKWRSPDLLTKIRDFISSGKEPELKGRESCLFLKLENEEIML